MKNTTDDIINHIYDMNMQYAEKIKENTGKDIEYYPYQYVTDAASFQITFLDQVVFCSENDSRYNDNNEFILVQILNDNVNKILLEISAYAKSRESVYSGGE